MNPPVRSLKSALFHTLGVSVVILVLGVMSVKLFARAFSVDEFGWIQLSRRLVGYVFPLFLLGFNVALVREIAYEKDRAKKLQLQNTGMAVALVAAAVLLFSGWLLDAGIGGLVLGTSLPGFGFAFCVLIAGTVMFNFDYAILRATDRIQTANILLLVIMGVLPLVTATIAVLIHPPFVLLVGGLGGASLLICLTVAFFEAVRRNGNGPHTRLSREPLLRLVAYGMRRVPISLLAGVIYSIGSIMLNHRHAAVETGLLMAALFIIRLIEQAVGPVAIVMLPHLSAQAGTRDRTAIANYARAVMGYVLAIGLFASAMLIVLNGEVLTVLFGAAYRAGGMALILVSLGIPAILGFSLMQTIIDALTHKGIVLRAMLTGVPIALIVMPFARSADLIALSIAASMTVIALMMARYLAKELQIAVQPVEIIKIVAGLCPAVLASVLMRNGLTGMALPDWGIIGTVGAVGTAIYLGISLVLKADWIVDAQSRFRRGA